MVLATEVFDRFLEDNDCASSPSSAMTTTSSSERFLRRSLPGEMLQSARRLPGVARYPLAVRSSSLLEDSQYQPLAGVYETYMLPNNHPDPAVRLQQLIRAVKRVYASTFLTYAKNYFKVTPYRLEEEKMAVIVQRLVGGRTATASIPIFAGVVRSYNFYPSGALARPRTGWSLWPWAWDAPWWKAAVRCPSLPSIRSIPSTSPPSAEMLANSQREFVALKLDAGGRGGTEQQHPSQVAETDGTLGAVASTYSPENDAVYDGISRPGVRLVSFAPLLQAASLPPAGDPRAPHGAGTPGDEHRGGDRVRRATFRSPEGRPSSASCRCGRWRCPARLHELRCRGGRPGTGLVRSDKRAGQRQDGAHPRRGRRRRGALRPGQEPARSRRRVARCNAALVGEGVPYILIGLGRWGSADPWLGIPVTWEQISGARVIVESGLEDMKVRPVAGQPLLPEPHLLPGGLLHGEPGRR